MSTTVKVFLACAIGAFVGAVVALELNKYFWWVGLLVGGFVGYISYEFKKVVMALPTAWRKARGWQPDREWWREYLKLFVAVINFGLNIAFPCAFLFKLLATLSLSEAFTTGSAIFSITVLFLMVVGFKNTKPNTHQMKTDLQQLPHFWKLYLWLLPKWILKGSWWLMRRAPTFAKELATAIARASIVARNFIVYLFKEIHSDIRMLCGLDAAIGAAIGYFAGSAVIGAAAGGLWGTLNFEILSIRILKLIPIQHSLLRRF